MGSRFSVGSKFATAVANHYEVRARKCLFLKRKTGQWHKNNWGPNRDAVFLLTVRSFFAYSSKLFYLQWSFSTHSFSSFTFSWSVLAYSGKVPLSAGCHRSFSVDIPEIR